MSASAVQDPNNDTSDRRLQFTVSVRNDPSFHFRDDPTAGDKKEAEGEMCEKMTDLHVPPSAEQNIMKSSGNLDHSQVAASARQPTDGSASRTFIHHMEQGLLWRSFVITDIRAEKKPDVYLRGGFWDGPSHMRT
ncbi:hypothetical protein CRENBAI_005440 [Crenichthys baileyi]|uniref:Uncharacterized protein n=1 Tax=Crenichthys baileyi TaxID=28760 RepID=A0AAV9SEV6_9TELE